MKLQKLVISTITFSTILVMVGCHNTTPPGVIAAKNKLPTFLARSLDERNIQAPEVLPPTPALILFGYSPDAQEDMDLWILAAKKQKLEVIEVAIIYDPLARPFSSLLAFGMRQHAPLEKHDKVWLVTSDADRLEAWIGGHDQDHAYAFLLNAEHSIVGSWLAGYPGEPNLRTQVGPYSVSQNAQAQPNHRIGFSDSMRSLSGASNSARACDSSSGFGGRPFIFS